MKKKRNIYILIGLSLALLVAAYYVFREDLSEWNYNLDKTKTNAYGTFLTYELIKSKYDSNFIEIDNNVVESFRILDSTTHYNYIFINHFPYYDSATIDTLCRFAYAGNTVFIGAEDFYGTLRDSIIQQLYHLKIIGSYAVFYEKNRDSSHEDKLKTTFNFIHPTLNKQNGYEYYQLYKADTIVQYFNQFVPFTDSTIKQPISSENKINFIAYENSYNIGLNAVELKHGKGSFVLILTALPFTNYFMRTKDGLEYTEKLFSYLPHSKTIWDNTSQINKMINDENSGFKNDTTFGESPIYFILKNKSLRWAWYLSIIGIIIYAIFHAKRRQNIIPIIEPKQNNSLKYVETIGQLYYQENEHIEIAEEMRIQFLNYIRQKYYLKTNLIDEEFIKTVAQKSNIEMDKIKAIFDELEKIKKTKSIQQKQLQKINKQLEFFYSTCK